MYRLLITQLLNTTFYSHNGDSPTCCATTTVYVIPSLVSGKGRFVRHHNRSGAISVLLLGRSVSQNPSQNLCLRLMKTWWVLRLRWFGRLTGTQDGGLELAAFSFKVWFNALSEQPAREALSAVDSAPKQRLGDLCIYDLMFDGDHQTVLEYYC